MTISEGTGPSTECWQVEGLPGDGLIAADTDHVLIVQMDDDIARSGFADAIVAAYNAYSRLLGRAAARSLRLAISTVLAEYQTVPSAIALISAWDDKLAIYLQGHAHAALDRKGEITVLRGEDSLIATEVVIDNDFDYLELRVGDVAGGTRVPLDLGVIAAGGGARLTWPQAQRPTSLLNEWSAAR